MSIAQSINQGHICPSRSLKTSADKKKESSCLLRNRQFVLFIKIIKQYLDIENSIFFNLSKKL